MSPSRDEASSLPPSVEEAYRLKCITLKNRMKEVEVANDQYRLRRERLVRGIRKMRLERAILLETLAKRMSKKGGGVGMLEFDEDTEDSTDSPPTPQERPMRIKRPHRRPDPFIHENTPMQMGESGRADHEGEGEGEGEGGADQSMESYARGHHGDNGREELGDDDDSKMDTEQVGEPMETETDRPVAEGEAAYASGSQAYAPPPPPPQPSTAAEETTQGRAD